jgi:hypothetical protein
MHHSTLLHKGPAEGSRSAGGLAHDNAKTYQRRARPVGAPNECLQSTGAHPRTPAPGARYWRRPPAWQPVHDRHDARDPLKSYLRVMANPYGVVLDDASLRWAAAESVSEAVIAAICLLETRSVDEIVAKLTPPELEQVIKIVGRSPRGYPPAAYDALKGHRRVPSPEPQPAERRKVSIRTGPISFDPQSAVSSNATPTW